MRSWWSASLVVAMLLLVAPGLGPGCGRGLGIARSDDDGARSRDAAAPDAAITTADAASLPDAAADAAAPPDCATLDLHDCRLRADCAPDTCLQCSCEPTFLRCRQASEPPALCPALGCASPICCDDDFDCGSGLRCSPDGSWPPCGTCRTDPGDCAVDGDCAVGEICAPDPCSCGGAQFCRPACGGARGCELGTSCLGDPDHPRCAPTPCLLPDDCPADFDCGVDGQCVRRPCADDLVCDGYCVFGACRAGYGICYAPVP